MNKTNLYIFDQYRKNNSKLIPLNIKPFAIGEVKYFPPVSKEWKNTIYAYNKNSLKNLPIYDLNINSLIQSYFNSYFNYKNLNTKYKPRRLKRLSLNKIYTSNAEIKHTNSKVILTIYTYNREKIALLKKIRIIKAKILSKVYKKQYITRKKFKWIKIGYKYFMLIRFFLNKMMHIKKFLKLPLNICLENFKFKMVDPFTVMMTRYIKLYNLNKDKSEKKINQKEIMEPFMLIRRYIVRYNLNKYKFEEKFLYLLSSLISKYYNKKVEFNIVNMKSIVLNSDLFTKILTKKIKKKKNNVIGMMKIILNRAGLPRVNRIIEKIFEVKSVNFNLLENKFLNPNLNHVLENKQGKDLYSLLNKNFYKLTRASDKKNSYNVVYNIIFNSIKYKNMGGIRLEVNGRLTKRYRADRAQHKLRWKGGLKNIDSSYKRKSTVNKLGYLESNVEYSIFTSKRRIGSFAVKGWIGGK